MRNLHELRDRIVDAPNSLGARRRSRRWDWLQATFPKIEAMSVIDLGGTVDSWLQAPNRPESVHIINLEPPPSPLGIPDWIRQDQADACSLPPHISCGRYDLAFSNSVLEHVGGHGQRMRFAAAVHQLADRHWVQTPYRYFPVEPHWLFPGFQLLPLTVRAEVARRWPMARVQAATRLDGLSGALSVELLSRAEMGFYFPDSVLHSERMLGLTKSLIAIKT